jgi:hypothetical protein
MPEKFSYTLYTKSLVLFEEWIRSLDWYAAANGILSYFVSTAARKLVVVSQTRDLSHAPGRSP